MHFIRSAITVSVLLAAACSDPGPVLSARDGGADDRDGALPRDAGPETCSPCGVTSCCPPSECVDGTCVVPMDFDAGPLPTTRTLCGRTLGEPVGVDSGGRSLHEAAVAARGDGTFVVMWGQDDGADFSFVTQAARSTTAGGWEPQVVVGRPDRTGFEWQIGVVGGQVVATWLEEEDDGSATQRGVWASDLGASGWTPPVRIGTAPRYAGVLTLSASDMGAVALWESREGPGVVAGVRSSTGGWTNEDVFSSSARWTTVAMGPTGAAMALWHWYASSDIRHAYTSYRPAGGGWQAPVEIDAAALDTYLTRLALLPDGGAVAVWQEPSTSPGIADSVRTARFDPATGWGAPELLETTSGAIPTPTIELDDTGRGFAIWKRVDATVAAAFDPTTGFGPPHVLVPRAGGNVMLDVNGGRAVAAWSRNGAAGSEVVAACYTPESGWSAVTRVSAEGTEAYGGSLALDSSGDAMIVWTVVAEAGNRLWSAHLR